MTFRPTASKAKSANAKARLLLLSDPDTRTSQRAI